MVKENRWRDLAILWSDEVGMPNPNRQSSKRASIVFTEYLIKYMGRWKAH